MARKMKDSGIEWIGEIPEGWEIRKIKNNFMIYAGATPKSEKPNTGTVSSHGSPLPISKQQINMCLTVENH